MVMWLAYPDILPFGVEQLEDDFSDALRVGKRPQGGVQSAVHDTPVLQRRINSTQQLIYHHSPT